MYELVAKLYRTCCDKRSDLRQSRGKRLNGVVTYKNA